MDIFTQISLLVVAVVVIISTRCLEQSAELYRLCVSGVEMPHHISSKKIGLFIKKNPFKKNEFRKYHEHHLVYLQPDYPFDVRPTEEQA